MAEAKLTGAADESCPLLGRTGSSDPRSPLQQRHSGAAAAAAADGYPCRSSTIVRGKGLAAAAPAAEQGRQGSKAQAGTLRASWLPTPRAAGRTNLSRGAQSVTRVDGPKGACNRCANMGAIHQTACTCLHTACGEQQRKVHAMCTPAMCIPSGKKHPPGSVSEGTHSQLLKLA